MTKMIYPTTGVWTGGMELLQDKQPMPADYTDIQPPQPAYKLEFRDGKWVETATDEEIESMQLNNEEPKLQPTPEQQMIAALMAKVTELEAKNE